MLSPEQLRNCGSDPPRYFRPWLPPYAGRKVKCGPPTICSSTSPMTLANWKQWAYLTPEKSAPKMFQWFRRLWTKRHLWPGTSTTLSTPSIASIELQSTGVWDCGGTKRRKPCACSDEKKQTKRERKRRRRANRSELFRPTSIRRLAPLLPYFKEWKSKGTMGAV